MLRTIGLGMAALAGLCAAGCDGDGGSDTAPRADAAPLPDGGAGGQWRPLAPMPVDTQETSVVALAGEVYVIGGLVSTNGNVDTVWIYDIANDAIPSGGVAAGSAASGARSMRSSLAPSAGERGSLRCRRRAAGSASVSSMA